MRHPDVLWSVLHGQQGGAPHALAVSRAVVVVIVVAVVVGVVAVVQAVGGGLAAVLFPLSSPPGPSQSRQIKLQTGPTEIKNKLSRPEKSEKEGTEKYERLKVQTGPTSSLVLSFSQKILN